MGGTRWAGLDGSTVAHYAAFGGSESSFLHLFRNVLRGESKAKMRLQQMEIFK